jgi:phospholipase C
LFSASSFGSLSPGNPPPEGWPYPTIFRTLTNAGISWRYYYQDTDIFLNNFQDRQLKPGHMFPLSQYFVDLQDESTFPQVVFIERAGSTGLDEHPPSHVQRGAAVVAHIIDSLLASPVWPSSVFFLSWDESGGLFDHVPPAAAVPPDNLSPKSFSTTGLRVPLIVVSPWVKPHFVSHVTREHTSILKFIETRFGLPPLTKRDTVADDMTEFFDFTEPHWIDPPILPSQPVDGKCDHTLEKAPGF